MLRMRQGAMLLPSSHASWNPSPSPKLQTPTPNPPPPPSPSNPHPLILTLTRFARKLETSEETRALWQQRGEALLEAALCTERKLLVMVRRAPR